MLLTTLLITIDSPSTHLALERHPVVYTFELDRGLIMHRKPSHSGDTRNVTTGKIYQAPGSVLHERGDLKDVDHLSSCVLVEDPH